MSVNHEGRWYYPPLRAHQSARAGLVAAIAQGEATGVTDILAAVTPGGGKSLLPMIPSARLIAAGRVECVLDDRVLLKCAGRDRPASGPASHG